MYGQDGAIHVVLGAEYDEKASSNGLNEFEVEVTKLSSKFKKFIQEFSYSPVGAVNATTQKYRDQFIQNCDKGIYRLELDMSDLHTYEGCEALVHNLQNTPTELVKICENASGVPEVQFKDARLANAEDRRGRPHLWSHVTGRTSAGASQGVGASWSHCLEILAIAAWHPEIKPTRRSSSWWRS